MINVKLIVLFFTFDIVASSDKYCQICPNHTLCKYNMPGPSPSCKDYEGGPITKDDADNIINRINERRNFVASGASGLPQSANMNKIYWSQELAAIAQRWVDQCDASTRPDKEDDCRDLDDTQVGQAIVSVVGPAPGLQLRSLIDVWFMQTRDYNGSVTYYNQSRDWKTNHFTQLIWGETDRIGCGRARFYLKQKESIVERLVCNFAPKGNIHGKPVYTVGFPGTQCQQNKMPDRKFKSLCQYFSENNVRKFTTNQPTVSSLLRILNLSNNPGAVPVRTNLKQVKFDVNETSEQRNQKTRHVLFNNSHALLKNMPPFQSQWNSPNNYTRGQRQQNYQQERGHSRVYHGHDVHDHHFDNNYRELTNRNYPNENYQTNNYPTNNFPSNSYPANVNYPINLNYRKLNDYTTEQVTPSATSDLRKYYRNNQCTRGGETENHNCDKCNQARNQCTRDENRNCKHITNPPCQADPPCLVTPEKCPCNTPTTCPTTPPKCQCNVNCRCLNTECTNTPCPPYRRSGNNEKKEETKKSGDLHYYDLLPNMAMRSGENANERSLPSEELVTSRDDDWIQHGTTVDDIFNRLTTKIKHEQKQVKGIFESKRSNNQDYDYIYDSPYSRERKRRNPVDDITFKPFWQMDEFNRDKSTLLKSIRYTTITNKRGKKTRRINPSVRMTQTTESITVQLKDGSKNRQYQKGAVTEKYLSFDELMHLRMLTSTETGGDTIISSNMNSDGDFNIDARRNFNFNARRADTNTSTNTSTTKEYTTNTPFKRKKHCTRKLTCTWTTPIITDSAGSVITNGGNDRGSKTPPGYVEGCTRTSTCTRDFMSRNKFSTIPDGNEGSGETAEDEDYCEKRALDVRKRDSEVKPEGSSNNDYQPKADAPYTTYVPFIYFSNEIKYTLQSTTPSTLTESCVCDAESIRIKRDEEDASKSRSECNKYSRNRLSYGDLYYLVLQKIIGRWNNSQHTYQSCFCNSASFIRGSMSLLFLIFLFRIIINLFI